MKKFAFSIAAILLSGMGAFAQDSLLSNSLSIPLEFRPRLEYRNGESRPLSEGEHPAFLVTNRLRTGIIYGHADLLKAKIIFQQVGLWGQAAPVQGLGTQNNSIGLFEGWVDLKIYKGLRTKIGRQTINLDDQRLFSESDWSQGGRVHDALSVYYSDQQWDIRSYFAFNQNYAALYQNNLNNPSGNFYNSDGAQSYKFMQTLWLSRQLTSVSKLSLLFTNIGYQQVLATSPNPDTTINSLQTIGGNYIWSKKPFGAYFSGYYQAGHNVLHEKVSAYLLSAGISGALAAKWQFSLHSDYLSGNKIQMPSGQTHVFSTLFGTGHPFYGQMDYYPSGNAGLWNQAAALGFIPTEKIQLKIAGHWFLAGHRFENNGIVYDRDLGQEIDANFAYTLNSFTQLSAGYSVYFTNENTEALKNVRPAKSLQDWFWLSLKVSPELFRAKF